MKEDIEEPRKTVVMLDGKAVTLDQIEEAKMNKAVRIIEDNNNPGQYRTLTRMQG